MLKKIFMSFLAACMSVSLLTGCATETNGGDKQNENIDSEIRIEYPDNMQEKGFTEAVVLDKMPEKVVVMSKAPVLALYELGVKMIAIPNGGVTIWPEDLDKSTEKLDVGMNSNFDIETVIALDPDLVLLSATSKDTHGKILTESGIPVYYIDAGHTVSYESVKSQTQALVNAFDKDGSKGKELMGRFDELESRLEKIKDKYSDKNVMVLQSAPPSHYIQTKQGTLASLADMMGFKNVYENDMTPMAELDLETALNYNPDLILCVGSSKDASEHQKLMEDDFAKNPEYWNSIEAIKNGNIIYFPSDYIASIGIGVIDNAENFIDTIEEFYAEK